METKAEEQAKLNKEELEHLQKRIAKITEKVERAMSAVNDVKTLMSTGISLYKNTRAQLEKIQRDVNDLKNTANEIGQNISLTINPATINRALGSATGMADSAFHVLDNGVGSLNYTLSNADFIPAKIQKKISEKELQRKLSEAQKKLKDLQGAAQKWIQENTQKYTNKINSRTQELQNQLNRQIQKAVNSISTFTGVDPAILDDLIERGEQTALAYITRKESAADQLDNLIGFAKSTALNHAMNMATAKAMKALDESGFSQLAADISNDIQPIKKLTGEALAAAGIANNLDGSIVSNIKDRLNINI